jgi:capsular exopolysaccharide synthesis family protein
MRWYFALAGALLGLVVALALSSTVTPQYRATSKLWISVSGDAESSALDLAQGTNAAQQRIHSYLDLVPQPIVLQPVIDELHLDMSASELATSVSATSPTGSVVMQIAVTSPDRERVARVTDSIVRSFSSVVQDRLDANASGVGVTVTQTSPAAEPTTPVTPRTRANAALGGAAGAGLGVLAAFLRWALDTKVRGRDEVQQLWDLPVLGDIGFDSDAAKQPIVLRDARASARAEAFRTLRTNVQFLASRPAGARTLAITSSRPSEGKTTTAANLAVALAESGLRTVVIDADLRRPNLANVFGVDGAAGLSDLLVGRVELDDVLQHWGRAGLTVLPSGTVPPNPSELVGSPAFTALIQDVAARFDVVIVDTPPLGSVTDAALVSRAVQNMLLVVASGRVRRAEVSSSIESLATVGASVQGIVVTMARSRGPRDAYAVYAADSAQETQRSHRSDVRGGTAEVTT